MRLFRQERPGDWRTVVEEVKRALEHATSDRDKPITVPGSVKRATLLAPSTREARPASGICRAVWTHCGMLQLRPGDAKSVRSLEFYGEYLRGHLDFLSEWIAPGAIVVEVQSGFGAHAVYLASTVGEAGHVFVLESRPELVPLLANNLRANGISNVTTIISSLRGMASDPPRSAGIETTGIAASLTIDALCLPKFQWLKINEAADPVEVLKGAADCVWKFRPSIFVSVDEVSSMDEVENCVADFGYRSTQIECPLFVPSNFNRRTEDIFRDQSVHGLLAIPEEHDIELS